MVRPVLADNVFFAKLCLIATCCTAVQPPGKLELGCPLPRFSDFYENTPPRLSSDCSCVYMIENAYVDYVLLLTTVMYVSRRAWVFSAQPISLHGKTLGPRP